MQLASLLMKRASIVGDLWGGLAAMLVALPAGIAFGVTVYSVIGPAYASYGALRGIVGVVCLGLVAAALGGTQRLITAPAAPATAVLSAFALQLVAQGEAPDLIVLLLVMVGIMAGVTQAALGLIGVGRLIKYIPYPVVSGFLTGVGLIIIGSQIPKFLGTPDGTRWWDALLSPSIWDWRALLIALTTVVVMVGAPRLTRRIPGTILGIAAGVLTYFGLALFNPELRQLANNTLVVGSLSVSSDGYFNELALFWKELGKIGPTHATTLLGTALTLGVLLSIDTLKTCVVLDQLTRSRHDSNRELIAQGIANTLSNAIGGISGSGTMGPTMIGLNSGSRSKTAGIFEGLFALIAALLLGAFTAWIPVATLAGILMLIGVRMLDRRSLQLVQSKSTVLDFAVVLIFVVVALTVSLIAASAVGVGLAIILFVREQVGGTVVRHKMELRQMSSSWHRPEAELSILERTGDQAVIFELQGSLFFGNTYQLYADLEHEISTRRYVIIDLRRVQSIDVTAAQLFNQIRDTIRERGARLVLSGIREKHPDGRNLQEFLGQTGLWHPQSRTVRILPDLDAAITWVEDRLLGESEYALDDQMPMQLNEMEIFSRHKDETLKDLEACMEIRSFSVGEVVYGQGSIGDELYWVRRGAVRLMANLAEGQQKPVASFGRGDFFGGLAFMDNQPRPNDAIAYAPTEVYVLSREKFTLIADGHKKLAFNLSNAIARTLAMRLRRTERKLTMLQEY